MRVILFTGGVETLDFFSLQLKKGFEELGLSAFVMDLCRAKEESKKLKKVIKTGETFVLTFNFEGLEREEGLFSLRDSYLWQQYGVPVYNIAVDHPYWYENRFADLLEDEEHHPGLLSFYHHFSIDRNHEKYFNTFYPEFKSAGFLPLAGTELIPQKEQKPPEQRGETILFAGHYTELPFFEKNITAINEEYEAFYRGIIKDLEENPKKTVEEASLAAVKRETGEEDIRKLRDVLYHMLFIDLYIRNEVRGKAVAALAEAGLPVTVIGKGWEKLPALRKDSLKILPMTDSAGVLRALCEARVALNVNPYFKDGAHDRVFNSVLNGAAVLSDSSLYLNEILPEGCGVSYYTLETLQKGETEDMIKKASELLSSPGLCREMVEAGRDKVRREHTWIRRAAEILEKVKKEG
jgi:glycosyltransferase involved in cell wall biosynthesis